MRCAFSPDRHWLLRLAVACSLLVHTVCQAASPVPAIAVGWGANTAGQATVPANLTNALAIAAGGTHSLAVVSSGGVVGWGDNTSGQAAVPPGLTGIATAAAGSYHSLALRGNGTVTGWGDVSSAQTTPPPGLSGVIAIAAGEFHSLALRNNGSVTAWGANGYGQRNIPTSVANITAIAAGANHNLARRNDGRVIAWGNNAFGQTNVPAGANSIIAVAAGEGHSLALRSDGIVIGWGKNDFGQASPPAGLNNVVEIAAGGNHSLARKANGTVVGWGYSADGQTIPPAGLTNVVTIAAGGLHSLALRLLPPLITVGPPNQNVNLGSSVTFSVTASGSGPLMFQWRKNGAPISSATNSIFTIANAQSTDAATYTVTVSNPVGSVTSTGAALQVTTPPTITTHPQSQSISNGGTAIFSVQANGSPPFSYQWRLNAMNIPRATNSTHTVRDAQAGDAGDYDVIVSNVGGSATSTVATLTIAFAPLISGHPVSQTAVVGSSVTFTVITTGATGHQWQKDGANIGGANGPSYTINPVQFSHAGSYRVLVSNPTANEFSDSAILTVSTGTNSPATSIRLLPPQRQANGRFRLFIRNSNGTAITPDRLAKLEVWAFDRILAFNQWMKLNDPLTLSAAGAELEDSTSLGLGSRFYLVVERP